jgi:hypothetical protein
VTSVCAEHRLIPRIWPVEVIAFSTLAFFRDRREDLRRIQFAEFVEHECVSDGLFKYRKDRRIDRSHHNPALVAAQRYLIAVLFRHNGPVAIDASGFVRHERKMRNIGGHGLMVAPVVGLPDGWRTNVKTRLVKKTRNNGKQYN